MVTLGSLDALLVGAAILLALTSLVFLAAAIRATRKKTLVSLPTLGSLLLALLFFSLAGLFGTLAIAIQGYRALSREEVAAVVRTEPIGNNRFRAHFVFANGEEATFELSGEELYVDAHIVKWKPIANLLGLHTSYELDRVAGRYTRVEDEQTKARTVFAVAKNRPVDLLQIRKLYWIFDPIRDVEYGSATFNSARRPVTYEIRVSTTGLLLREVPPNVGER
jgi:hypothetical protein